MVVVMITKRKKEKNDTPSFELPTANLTPREAHIRGLGSGIDHGEACCFLIHLALD